MTKRLLFGLLALLFSQSLTAQPPKALHRPKIALVLEGGGALGLAHIGVIEWLEQNHIPIDFVAGTSMGGLVGGFYASGQSPAEIREFVKSVDWSGMLGDKLAYQYLDFRRKEDKRDFPNSLEFGIHNGVRFPSGFSPGHQVGLMIDHEMYSFSELRSFDDLPIPFRCVALDLVSRKEKVFNSGSLSQALRSTMSIPAVFSPVRTADAIYVDGGLLNNLPTDIARQMGADLVIAVHLRTQSLAPTQAMSSFGVLNESLSVVVSANEMRNMEHADILITVDASKFSSTDYKRSDELISEGFVAASQKSGVLKPLAVDDQAWRELLEARRAKKPSVVVPSFVRVQGGSPALAEEIEKRLTPQIVGHELDFTGWERDLNHLMGSGRFSQVGYDVVSENGQRGLIIRTLPKDYAPPTVNPIIELDGSEYRNTEFMAGARFTFFDIGAPGSEWRSDLLLGSEYVFNSEYYRPLRPFGKWFVAPSVDFGSRPFDIYKSSDYIAQYRMQSAAGGFDVGYALSRSAEFRVGYVGGYSRVYRVIGDQKFENNSGRIGTTSIKYAFDGLDSPLIPSKGLLVASKLQWHDAVVGGSDPFPSAELRTVYVKPISTPASIYVDISAGSTLGFANSGIPIYSLGGPARLSSYGRNELLTNQYALGRLGYLRRLMKLPPLLGGGIYLTGAYEIGKAYGVEHGPSLPMDGTAGLVIETAFGPLFLGGSVGDGGHRKLLFRLGRFF